MSEGASAGSSGERPAVEIERVLEPGEEHVEAIRRLLPQLSSAPPPELATLARICEDRRLVLLVARLDGVIVGSLSLVVFELLTGVRALVEDVVVDADTRGRGVGAALVEQALRLAAELGARSVDLTSRPSREAANRLYERAGFARRETNVWRYSAGS